MGVTFAFPAICTTLANAIFLLVQSRVFHKAHVQEEFCGLVTNKELKLKHYISSTVLPHNNAVLPYKTKLSSDQARLVLNVP